MLELSKGGRLMPATMSSASTRRAACSSAIVSGPRGLKCSRIWARAAATLSIWFKSVILASLPPARFDDVGELLDAGQHPRQHLDVRDVHGDFERRDAVLGGHAERGHIDVLF